MRASIRYASSILRPPLNLAVLTGTTRGALFKWHGGVLSLLPEIRAIDCDSSIEGSVIGQLIPSR